MLPSAAPTQSTPEDGPTSSVPLSRTESIILGIGVVLAVVYPLAGVAGDFVRIPAAKKAAILCATAIIVPQVAIVALRRAGCEACFALFAAWVLLNALVMIVWN